MLIGAHVSIAGGIENAISNAHALGCETFQIFTKNQNQWREKEYSQAEVERFKSDLNASKMWSNTISAHDSYLINLCANDPDILSRSRDAFLNEIKRCTSLGIPYLIFHPGAHLGNGEEWGISGISESLLWALERSQDSNVVLVLETTAGQGSHLGYRLEHLKRIIDNIPEKQRIGICVDTCHIFAAGYDLRDPVSYEKTITQIDQVIGLNYIKAFHLNDSKRELGSRVDRHENIGEGQIGDLAFRLLINDERFTKHPGILEIPGGDMAYKNGISKLFGFRDHQLS